MLFIGLSSCQQANSHNQESSTTEVQQNANKSGYAIGDIAADFSLPSTQGTEVSMSDYPDAKGFIVIFTCNHCPYAKMYEQRIMDLDAKYAEQGYPVIAINPNDPEIVPEDGMEEMISRAEEKGYSFPYLWDEKQEVYPVYGATKTPHVYLLNKQEEGLVVRYIGAIDDNHRDASDVSKKYVEDAIEAISSGQEIEVTESRAIGCSIKDKRKG